MVNASIDVIVNKYSIISGSGLLTHNIISTKSVIYFHSQISTLNYLWNNLAANFGDFFNSKLKNSCEVKGVSKLQFGICYYSMLI